MAAEFPLDDAPLEGDDEMLPEEEADPMAVEGGELDPQFAADVAEAFPDLDDAQLTALQRAFMGLMVR
jgi:hypothetical protein